MFCPLLYRRPRVVKGYYSGQQGPSFHFGHLPHLYGLAPVHCLLLTCSPPSPSVVSRPTPDSWALRCYSLCLKAVPLTSPVSAAWMPTRLLSSAPLIISDHPFKTSSLSQRVYLFFSVQLSAVAMLCILFVCLLSFLSVFFLLLLLTVQPLMPRAGPGTG